MDDELRQLMGPRPEDRPRAEVAARHRAALLAAVAGDGRRLAADGREPGGVDELPLRPVRSRPASPLSSPRRRAPRLVAAAAAVATVATLVGVISTHDGSRRLEATAPAHEPAAGATAGPDTTTPDHSALTCGDSVTALLTVPSGGDPISASAPGAPPAAPGQLVQHWQRDDGWVEIRWPALPPATYDLDHRPDSAPWVVTSGAGHAEIRSGTDDRSGGEPDPGDHALLIVDQGGAAPPTDACRVLDVSFSDGDAAGRLGLDLSQLQSGGLDLVVPSTALVTSIEQVEVPPADVIPCEGGEVDRRGGEVMAAGADVTPVAALERFLGGSGAPSLAPGGYAELHEADGSITYARRTDGGYVTLVSVIELTDGWVVDRWRASGC